MRKLDLDRLNMEPLLNTTTRSSCALDYDFKSTTLFWSDVMEEKIYSMPVTGGERSVVVEEGGVTASSKNQPNNADHLVRVPRRYEAVQGLANMRCQKPSKENVNDNCTSAAKEKANNNKRDNIARDEIRNNRDADSAPWRG